MTEEDQEQHQHQHVEQKHNSCELCNTKTSILTHFVKNGNPFYACKICFIKETGIIKDIFDYLHNQLNEDERNYKNIFFDSDNLF